MKRHHLFFGKLGQNKWTVFAFHFKAEYRLHVLISLTTHWIFMLN
jgi:hypothetical protein